MPFLSTLTLLPTSSNRSITFCFSVIYHALRIAKKKVIVNILPVSSGVVYGLTALFSHFPRKFIFFTHCAPLLQLLLLLLLRCGRKFILTVKESFIGAEKALLWLKLLCFFFLKKERRKTPKHSIIIGKNYGDFIPYQSWSSLFCGKKNQYLLFKKKRKKKNSKGYQFLRKFPDLSRTLFGEWATFSLT